MSKTVVRVIALLLMALLLAVFASSSVPLAIAEDNAPSAVHGAVTMEE